MIRAAWVHYRIADPSDGIGRGFLSTAFHLWRAMKASDDFALVDAGQEGEHPRTHLHVCPFHVFRPVRGKHNVLFTMWEGDVLPEEFQRALASADQLIVPSEYCREVWARHGFRADVVPLGLGDEWRALDANRRTVHTRDRRLRFLWCGSRAVRKGWPLLAPAWRAAFADRLDVQLYVKTIGAGEQKVEEHYGGHVVVDTRDLEPLDLLRLYESADVFVFPTLGEGFGLPALEAMAAGCLTLAPLVGGLTDFFGPATGIPIRRSQATSIDYGARYTTTIPTPVDVAVAMRMAADGWGRPEVEALRQAGTHVARTFTWRASAERLAAALSAGSNVLPFRAGAPPRSSGGADRAGGYPQDAPDRGLVGSGGPA